MVALQSPTEDRIDIERYEDDLPARTLPGLRPARFEEIAKGERALYLDIRRVWRRTAQHIWQLLRLPGKAVALAGEPWQWTPQMEAEFDRAARWFAQGIMGEANSPEAFANPRNDLVPTGSPFNDGSAVLPEHLRTGFEVGIERAVAVTDIETAALVGMRNADAQGQMLRRGFERLSEGARVTLADVLTAEDYRGGSVRDLLQEAMARGDNPLTVARSLRVKFREVEHYNWARLSRTEIAFAQNHAMQAEYEAEGYRTPRLPNELGGQEIALAPYHPNCVCGRTIDPDTGYILPDVAVTACEICQAALSLSKMATGGATGRLLG